MLKNIATYIFLILSASIFLFDRSFIGVKIFGYPLGYLFVALGGLFTIIFLIVLLQKDKNLYLNSLIFLGIILLFFVNLIYYKSNIFSSYVIKSSSPIWMLGYFAFFTKFSILNQKILDNSIKFFLPIPILLYFFNTGYYPNIMSNFFTIYSDKFTFSKASDVTNAVIIISILLLIKFPKKLYSYYYIFLISALLLPMLLYMSRGSFVGLILFLLILIFQKIKIITKNLKEFSIIFLISFLVFFISTIRISDEEYNNSFLNFFNFEKNNIQVVTSEEVIITEVIEKSLTDLSRKGETRNAFLSLYISNGRLMSEDQTTNWRLDIWQDVIEDLFNKNKIFIGYGYNSIFPVMLDPTAPGRLGRDGLNENVHNYFVNLLGRGGILNLIFFLLMQISIFKYWRKNLEEYNISILYILPALFIASLDTAMEGVQFPLLYFSYLGVILKYCKFKIEIN